MPVVPSIYAIAQRQQPDPAATLKMGPLHPASRIWDRSVPGDISKAYLRRVSTGLSFTEDVVKERCYSSLPYDKKYLNEAFDISHIVAAPLKSRHLLGRHDPSITVKRHLPCNLRPLGKKAAIKAAKLHEDVAQRVTSGRSREREGEEEEMSSESTFLTEIDIGSGKKSEWDKHIVSILSQPTAEWIVHKHVSPGEQHDDLTETLEQHYGTLSHNPELIRDCVSEEGTSVAVEDERRSESARKRWKKANETLLDRVRDLTEKRGLPTDPYCDETAAAFYRLPAGIRRARRQQQKQDDGAINKTARNVEVVPFLPPPPPGLRESLHPGVGDKIFDTSNPFQQERLIGVQQVRGLDESDKEIVLETNNHYRKQLQDTTPRDPMTWFPQAAPPDSARKLSRRPMIGTRHWTSLPQLIQFDYANASTGSSREDKKDVPLDHSNSGLLDTIKSADPDGQRKAMTNSTLLAIVNDWRTKWNLDMRYADATPDDLIRDMADIHVHIKLKAITTCARAAEYRAPPQLGIHLSKDKEGQSEVKLLPEELFVALECCLEDPSDQVKRAAAITLYTLERPVPKAEVLLRQALRESVTVDRWTAAQCLAYYGECDSEVVGELIRQLLNSTDQIHREQSSYLLARLSENSTLVHSMLAEQLNSSSWRHRVMTCTILPKLQGNINKDIVNKLLYLMWNDWHTEVRKVAAQSLGRTGHGKAVHDELISKITRGTERSKLEALSKLGHLGIMTAKLLPPFLECFHSNYVSVRMETCIACSNLAIKDEAVTNSLIYLTTYDGIWKVKALALQALGKIGVMTQAIRDCILWAFRYEKVSGVRAEACHSIIALHMTDKEVIQCLQDRYLVEPNNVVKEEIVIALEMCAISPSEDMDMVTQIKNEVTKMCTRNNVCTRILLSEKEEAKQDHINRLIYRAKKTAAISQEMMKATEARERMESIGRTSVGIDGIITAMSRPSSREIAAADSEVQAITARTLSPPTATESHTTTSLSSKSRPTDKTSTSKATTISTYDGSEAGSDISATPSRRSTTSQLAAAAMAAARGKSERRRHQRGDQIVGECMEEPMLGGGDGGNAIIVDEVDEKASDGKGTDSNPMVPADDAANVIAYFFQRYDNIGIPNDDDLTRMWEERPTDDVTTTDDKTEKKLADVRMKLSPVTLGTGDAWHDIIQTPVDNNIIEGDSAQVVSEVRHNMSGNDSSRFPDALSTVTGVRDGHVDVEGEGQAIVDNERPHREHDDVSAHERSDVGISAEAQDESAERREDDSGRETERGAVETTTAPPRGETGSRDGDEHQDAKSNVFNREEEVKSADAETERSENGERQEEGHRETAENAETEGQKKTEPSETEGHRETATKETEEHQEAEPVETDGQQGTHFDGREGHEEATTKETERHEEAECDKTERHEEAEHVEIGRQQEAESDDKDAREEPMPDPERAKETTDTDRHQAEESDVTQ